MQVLIIGAGIGGLAASISISLSTTHSVLVLDKASELREAGAGIQVPPNASRILRSWGLGDELARVSVAPGAFRLMGWKDGKVLSEQPLEDVRASAGYWHVHRADLHALLVQRARDLGVEIRLNSHVTDINFSAPSVVLSDGTVLNADLIIGADGLKSRSREALLGRSDPPRLTGDLAYRILIKSSLMRAHEDLREFVDRPTINFWMGPKAHAVSYLLKGDGYYNIVLICPDNLPERVDVANASAHEIEEFFEGWDPRLRRMIERVTEVSKWRLHNSTEMESWTHKGGRFVLLGDACHATLPYLAQGAAMAVEDGAVLGGLLGKLEHKSQLAGVLKVYESMRKSRTTRIVQESTHQRHVFHLEDGEEQRRRDTELLADKVRPGFPNKWRDPAFRDFLFNYDAAREVEAAWAKFKGEEKPVFRSML